MAWFMLLIIHPNNMIKCNLDNGMRFDRIDDGAEVEFEIGLLVGGEMGLGLG